MGKDKARINGIYPVITCINSKCGARFIVIYLPMNRPDEVWKQQTIDQCPYCGTIIREAH